MNISQESQIQPYQPNPYAQPAQVVPPTQVIFQSPTAPAYHPQSQAQAPRGIAAAALTLGIVCFLIAGYALWTVQNGASANAAQAQPQPTPVTAAAPEGEEAEEEPAEVAEAETAEATPLVDKQGIPTEIHEFLDRFEVSGVKVDGPYSKMLAGGRMYRVHSMVEPTLGLRVKAMDAQTITFVTHDGSEYVKYY